MKRAIREKQWFRKEGKKKSFEEGYAPMPSIRSAPA